MRARAGLAGALAAALATAPAARAESYVIRTQSFDCDWCAEEVREAFEALPQVVAFEADVDGAFLVRTRPGARLDPARVRALLERHGFAFRGMEERR